MRYLSAMPRDEALEISGHSMQIRRRAPGNPASFITKYLFGYVEDPDTGEVYPEIPDEDVEHLPMVARRLLQENVPPRVLEILEERNLNL